MKKSLSISRFFESDRSTLIDAAIKEKFLENLQINENEAFDRILRKLYKKHWAKTEKYKYRRRLKILWERNKDILTKEINQIKKTGKEFEEGKRKLHGEQINVNTRFT